MIEPMAFLHIPLHLEPLIMSDAQTLLVSMTHTKSNSSQNNFYCPSSHARHQMIRLRSLHPNVISPKGSPMRCLYNHLNTPNLQALLNPPLPSNNLLIFRYWSSQFIFRIRKRNVVCNSFLYLKPTIRHY